MNASSNTEKPFDPRTALAAISTTEATTRKALGPNVTVLYLVWAATYLLGYGLLHATTHGWITLSYPVALLIGATILLGAIIFSAALGIRSGTQIRGDSRFAGMAYGFSWMGGFATVAVFSIAFANLLPDAPQATVGWIINSVAILVVSLMYMAGAAIFQDRPMFVLGACFTVLNVVGLLAGPNLFMAFFALGGPALFIAAALLMRNTSAKEAK
ncbi:hypothetical protein CQ018_04565 [Arthrobacter sp. MYb227]|uniref:hypothetical protein n=1 Tax=Arthrobacter sp. MYb227 TaxID=1848601 RepID=UPI000CFC65E2|nr:hypothetical protein [Arthrobacter sp. MYb227]PQZ94634.1 hypothetical protein CQ018_04565 [Arthrobacter sp. MYb227]